MEIDFKSLLSLWLQAVINIQERHKNELNKFLRFYF
jgi:hypothetical protein